MRKIALSILAVAFFSLAVNVQSGTVIVKISGVKEIKGQILIGLYNKSKGFSEIGKEYKGIVIKIKAKSVTYTFLNIPNGHYAIAAVHDINNNGKVDCNFLGLPKELYAFSGDTAGCIGRPGFNKAKFKLSGQHTAKIKLK